ncbi:MAG: hypothetical protein SGCHY_001478, partial [Lobulomycetales sp.]
APPDPILQQNVLYKADTFKDKISVGVGAYRTEEGKPYVLKCVRKAQVAIADADNEYLPMQGLEVFNNAAAKLILGADSPVIKEGRYVAFQTLSGTGGVRIGAEFLHRFRSGVAYVSNPTWGNHHGLLGDTGLEVREYNYWDPETRGLNWASYSETLRNAPDGSIFVIHACAHNPTGVDPTREQWKEIAEIMKAKNHFPFFDCAYQGFASGDLERDAWPVRYFVSQGFELFVSQSFAKNLGLYGQRIGCLTAVVHDAAVVKPKIVRAMYSNPPAYGARIAATVLTTPDLYDEWVIELKGMADRIMEMRKALYELLVNKYKTPGTWNHIIDQIGMFTFTGLNPAQCKCLVEKYHIYLTMNGRISIAGLNKGNIEYFAESLDWAVRNAK